MSACSLYLITAEYIISLTEDQLKKILTALTASAVVLAASSAAAFYLVSAYIIPSVIAPRIVLSINETFEGAAKLSIGRVSLDIQKGLYLEDVELISGGSRLFAVKEADITLDFSALLKRELMIKEVLVSDTELTIARDSKGAWNFSPLLRYFDGEKKEGKTSARFRTIRFSGCTVRFLDRLQKRNSIERIFVNGHAEVENVGKGVVLVWMSADGRDASKESFSVKMVCETKTGSCYGTLVANTSFLEEYWSYYLDDIFFPWHLKAQSLELNGRFSIFKDELDADVTYTVKRGVLRYGTIEARSDAVIEQKLKLLRAGGLIVSSSVKALFKEAVIPLEKEQIKIKDLYCAAQLTNSGVRIERVRGRLGQKGFAFSGRYTFDFPRNLYLTGKYADAYGIIGLRLHSLDTAEAFVKGKTKGVSFEVFAHVPSIKDLLADIKMKARFTLPASGETVKASLQVGDYDINVRVDLSARLKGYLNRISTINGSAEVLVSYLSGLSPKPGSFNISMSIRNGLFEGSFPKTPFYKGTISGLARTDMKKWGLEAHIEGFDLSDFSRISPKYKNLKGKMNGSVVCVAPWADILNARGGGYVDLKKANLRNVPLFSNAEAGVAGLDTGFTMPEIESIKGNFGIREKKVVLENMACKAYRLNLYLSGFIGFDKTVNVTVGVKLIAGFWKTLRQVLLPFTIPFDIAASSVKIGITGKLPDLKQSTSLMQMQWMNEFFDVQKEGDPQRYRLEDCWKE